MPRFKIWLIVTLTLIIASAAEAEENILVIVADTVGPGLIGAYDVGNNPAPTPNIDYLAGAGVLFRKATSNPYGGPTRATLLTGRYGFRTDVGGLKPAGPPVTHESILDASMITLPEMLAAAGVGYRSAALGEWAVGPLPQGFEYYAGAPDDIVNYRQFTKTRHFADGTSDQVQVACDGTNTDPVVEGHSAGRAEPCYEPTNLVDEAILKIQEFGWTGDPWLVWVAFHTAQSPLHQPPADLLPSGRRYNWGKNADKLRGMIEAMDTEIGRLLAAIPTNTTVFFVSDRASTDQVINCQRVVSSCTRVPLIVRRPGSAQWESAAVVNTTDLFATVADLAGVTSSAEDSVSLLPYLADPALATQDRPSAGGPYAYAEQFDFDANSFDRAIRDDRYRYVWTSSGGAEPVEALYDLSVDPKENTNRLDLDRDGIPNPPQAGAEQAAYAALTRAIFETLHDPDRDLIPYQQDTCANVANRLDNSCDTDGDGIGNACDCDFNNDGFCNLFDFSILSQQFNADPPTDFNPDMNCDGAVDSDDFEIWQQMFNQLPGPSGLYCADPTQTGGTCTAPSIPSSGVSVRSNILVLIADDVGTDLVNLYQEFDPMSPTPPVTDNIDMLAHSLGHGSVYFRDAYAAPLCSPARAMLLTGRYGFRTGVGWVAPAFSDLRPAETTIAEMLRGSYRTAALGKWHLGDLTATGSTLPTGHPDFDVTGFEYYAGFDKNLALVDGAYYSYQKLKIDRDTGTEQFWMSCEPPPTSELQRDPFVEGRLQQGITGFCSNSANICTSNADCAPGYCRNEACYDTANIVDEAIARIDEYGAQPWLIWVGFHAVHTPLDAPPDGLLSVPLPSGATDPALRQAMMEAIDTEIGRLIEHVRANAPNTTIFFLGDNGTAIAGCKLTVSECGVRVPLIVSSPETPAGANENPALANVTDLFATVAEIAGIEAQADDSESLLSHVTELNPVTPFRDSVAGPYIYSERFRDAGFSPQRTIRNDRYKYSWSYIRSGRPRRNGFMYTLSERFFDLTNPTVNLLNIDFRPDVDLRDNPEALGQFALLESTMHDTLHDPDGDGVDHQTDNCTLVANPRPVNYDDDGDGIGNYCDCDFDQEGLCAQADLDLLQANLGVSVSHTGGDPLAELDMDGSGVIDAADEALVIAGLNQPPGPSGLDCADPLATGGGCQPEVRPIGCGNGTLQKGESCDVTGTSENFDNLTCLDFGCTGGALSCTATCSISFASCTGCDAGGCDNDGVCETGEDCSNCPNDCISGTTAASCGNGTCDAWGGETCLSCPQDCNGKQNGPASGRFCCGDPGQGGTVPCSDSRCSSSGFTCSDAQVSYCCGDSVCEGAEDSSSCELDCGPPLPGVCGDGICDVGEDCTTCADCEGKLKGPASKQFCCGNGTPEGPEGDGTRCDGNF